MGLKAEVFFEDMVFRAKVFFRQMHQQADWTGKPTARPTGHLVDLVFESSKKTDAFLVWLLSQSMKELKIVFSPVTGVGKSRTLLLRDAYCLDFSEHFSSTSSQPMTTRVSISVGIVDDGGIIHFEQWRVSDIHPEQTEIISVSQEPKLIDCYFTDLDGNKQAEPKTGDEIYLVLKTENAIGKLIDIDLSDHLKDFIYNEEIIENDIIKDFHVTSNLHKIKLKIVVQQEENE